MSGRSSDAMASLPVSAGYQSYALWRVSREGGSFLLERRRRRTRRRHLERGRAKKDVRRVSVWTSSDVWVVRTRSFPRQLSGSWARLTTTTRTSLTKKTRTTKNSTKTKMQRRTTTTIREVETPPRCISTSIYLSVARLPSPVSSLVHLSLCLDFPARSSSCRGSVRLWWRCLSVLSFAHSRPRPLDRQTCRMACIHARVSFPRR